MKTTLFQLAGNNWETQIANDISEATEAGLVLCFAAKEKLTTPDIYTTVKNKFPAAQIILCSTAGEIFHDVVQDNSLVAVALTFDDTAIKTAVVNITGFENSYTAAEALVKKIPQQGLVNMLVFSDGGLVNGSELVKGLNDAAENKILITGGLAGDGSNFVSTLVGLNEQPAQGNIVAIGFYGEKIAVTHGSQGGWDTFGPEREVSKSAGNKLFEIDGKNALELYTRYLGPDADQLPGSALLFPLSVTIPGSPQPVVRTILSIDNEQQSMTFAGDIPEGSKVRFMKANFDKLTSAAAKAAQQTLLGKKFKPGFSLLVSCVGRKLILGGRIDEEVEAVIDSLGEQTPVAGFYSYGEISPFNDGGDCRLHNQTMTITSFYELP
ncbi:FIST signal transduction protein [Ferruginibacter sp. SUN106]|uniref:FIST signal transduction protein n=1 Tax=Ferruginibacter sp. SUN106 TaxID=2978348 RepID=UPI003D36160C